MNSHVLANARQRGKPRPKSGGVETQRELSWQPRRQSHCVASLISATRNRILFPRKAPLSFEAGPSVDWAYAAARIAL